MAMIVQSTTYRTPDGAYSASCRVTYEPKTGLYEVNLYVNNAEHERGYFDDRKTALVFANTGLMDRWLNPVEWPEPEANVVIMELPGVFSLPRDDEPSTEPAPVDRYGRTWDERYEVPEMHLSSNPAQCGCGDCLTFMAGQ